MVKQEQKKKILLPQIEYSISRLRAVYNKYNSDPYYKWKK